MVGKYTNRQKREGSIYICGDRDIAFPSVIYYGSTKPDVINEDIDKSLELFDSQGDLVDILSRMRQDTRMIPRWAWRVKQDY